VGADWGARTGTSYSVLLEEVKAMPPASHADEPLGSDGKANPERQDIIVSGPRFATLVKLPQSPSEIAVTPTVPTNQAQGYAYIRP
jgi:hypothetical protein